MILGRKKIILLIIGLIALNLAFVFDIFYMQRAGAQQGYCGSREKVNIYPESAIITEHRGCDKNCQSVNRGRLLFKYYGENSDCQSSNIKGPQGERECYENFPFGGPGTLETGGNWVMSDARGFYFNGRDSSGYHWLQSGTQAEPMGTVMGFKTGLE